MLHLREDTHQISATAAWNGLLAAFRRDPSQAPPIMSQLSAADPFPAAHADSPELGEWPPPLSPEASSALLASRAQYEAEIASKCAADLAAYFQSLWVTVHQLQCKVSELEEWKKNALEDVRKLRDEHKVLRRKVYGDEPETGVRFERSSIRAKTMPPQYAATLASDSEIHLASGGMNAAYAFRALPAVCAASAFYRRVPSRTEPSDQDGWSPRFTCFGEAMLRYVPDPRGGEESPFAARWLRSVGGAELNITVALSRLGWGGRSRWVSVVPQGVLGDDFLSVLGKAYPDGQGCENLRLVRREAGDVGIYHVWPKEHKLWFQRHRSVFGLMDPGWFSREFWIEVLSEDASSSTPQVLHLTGITPLITVNTRTAWAQALEAAMALKQETSAVGRKLVVTMDLNHRPALGPWGDLWQMAEPHLRTVDVLVFSIGDVIQVGNTFGERFADDFKVIRERSPGLAGAKELDQTVCQSIAKLQLLLGSRTNLAVTCKVREVQTPPGQPPSQLRWSVLCTKEGDVLSTFSTAVPQKVVEAFLPLALGS
eukprot:s1236_g5.t1